MNEHLVQEHLSEEKILAFSEHQLSGIDYVDVLRHIETCEECRKKIIAPTKAEIIEQILSDNSSEKLSQENHIKSLNDEKSIQRNWLQKIKDLLFKKN
jgi:hypothetical protein